MNEQWRLAQKHNSLWVRATMIQEIRRFFVEREYLEIETPVRVPVLAPESHIDAVRSEEWFLHTSPELCMKRLLAAGYKKIFQICKCFRDKERGRAHLPEFTMLEWYIEGNNYYNLMEMCEDLVLSLAQVIGKKDKVTYRGRNISFKKPWERITVHEAFRRFASLPLAPALENNRFDKIMVSEIEPNLDCNKPVFLYDYPIELGSLAKANQNNPAVAERFELYIGGLELANAFSELTDVDEQRCRFKKEHECRQASGKLKYPSPEKFLQALAVMPEAAGIALGIDRLAMLFTDSVLIDDVVAFVPEDL